MDYARSAIGKHSRMAAASASATSRKNKLQRCSQCGGLGHKSRTCENSKSLQPQDLSDDCLSPTSSPDRRRVTFADDFDKYSAERAFDADVDT